MSKKNQSTFVPSEWAKHLKPFGKKKQASKERKAAMKKIIKETREYDDYGDN